MKKITKFNDYSEMSTDLNDKIEMVDVEKLAKGEYQIEEILGIIQDPKDIEKFDKMDEANKALLNTDISVKEVKRGDTIYISCLLRPAGTTNLNSQAATAVLKVRVVDIYKGLTALNKFMKK